MVKSILFAVLVLASSAAQGATISLVSMHYSAAQPVPHIRYDGETTPGDADTLRQIVEQFVKCGNECAGPEGRSAAVVTLNGPGGSYGEGLTLADYFRAHSIATVVERGSFCYSACAFAFLGGSGYSGQQGVGSYVDRQIEPGATVGFHAPYFDEASLVEAIKERGATEAMGLNRDNLAIMVGELVKWNVDPAIMSYMVGMGPNETYDIVNAEDYYLVRAALPPTPSDGWITDLPSAVKNACMRLLAMDERTDPLVFKDAIDAPWQDNIGTTKLFGPVSGYHWSDDLLDVGGCGITAESAATKGDYEIALFWNPGLDGTIEPETSFFNRHQGWSSAGPGRNPTKKIFQKGSLNHFFLPVGVPLDGLDVPGQNAIAANRFAMRLYPMLPDLDPRFETISHDPATRVSHAGNVWLFEQVGPQPLFDAAVQPTAGVTSTSESASESSFFREGQFPGGTSFSEFGLVDGSGSFVAEMMVLPPDGAAPTAEELALLEELPCNIRFGEAALSCS